MTVQGVRRLLDHQERHDIEMAQSLGAVTAREALSIGTEDQRKDVPRAYAQVLAHMVNPAHMRRGPPRRLHGRHLALQEEIIPVESAHSRAGGGRESI